MKTRRTLSLKSRETVAAWIAGFIILIAACDVMSEEYSAAPQLEQETSAAGLTQLERVFWLCDYVATTRGVDAAPVDTCAAATEALKNAKFGGDFMALLAWWQGRKPEEHARLSRPVSESTPAQPANEATAYPAALPADRAETRI